jgi:uncharacterized SAM-binding protein YcdF (DUF218 family)
MDEVYAVFKGFLDPLFIVFVLFFIAFIILFLNCRKKSDTLILLLSIVLIYGAGIQPVSNYLSYELEKDYINSRSVKDKNPLDVIVALSGSSYDIHTLNKTFPGEITTVRLVHAVQMYKDYKAQYLVCSGKGDSKISNAELMAQMAEELGVPRDKIRVEAKSENTYQNAVEFNKMFGNKNIKIGLVTSAFHMKRSEREFKKYFNNVLPLPAHYLYSSPKGNVVIRYIPQSEELYKTSIAIREIVGQLWYRLK